MGRIEYAAHQFKQALSYFNEALEWCDDEHQINRSPRPSILLNRGTLLSEQGHWKSGEHDIEAALASFREQLNDDRGPEHRTTRAVRAHLEAARATSTRPN